MFAAFIWEKVPPVVVVICAVAFLIAAGILSTENFVGVFANPAPIAIGAFFMLSGALVKTGALQQFADFMVERGDKSRSGALLIGAVAILIGSAFLNNTPVVMVMIPVVVWCSAAQRA